MNPQQAHFNMVEQQIRPWQVLDPHVLAVLSNVSRELFVPAAYQALAYADTEIPLSHGQSMVPPRVDARLMHDLQLTGTENVLEIGTGSGYLTALLAARAQRVVSLEIKPELASIARHNLQRAGVHNVDVRVADASQGLANEGPFDAIVLGGSVTELPQTLLQLLSIGGRLIAIVGDEGMMNVTLWRCTGKATWTSKILWEASAPRLQGFAAPSRFTF